MMKLAEIYFDDLAGLETIFLCFFRADYLYSARSVFNFLLADFFDNYVIEIVT